MKSYFHAEFRVKKCRIIEHLYHMTTPANHNPGFLSWTPSIIIGLEVIEAQGLASEERHLIVFWRESMLKRFIFLSPPCNTFR